MFVFHVRSSQVGWSVITDLCDQVVGVGGVVNKKKIGWKSVDDNWDGLIV